MAQIPVLDGAKIYIGGAAMEPTNVDFVAGDFGAVTWTEIDGWETIGALGDDSETVSVNLLNRGRTLKQKGTANAGSMENTFVHVPGDAGQAALIAASASSNNANYPFRIVYDDAPEGGTGSEEMFVGLAMSWQTQGGGANDPRRKSARIEVNSNVVYVPAAEAAP